MSGSGFMRRAVMRERRFVVEECAVPEPGAGQVLVKTRACGICGSDLHVFRHADELVETARSLGAPTDELERSLACGLVLGHEFVAEVTAFGPQTRRDLKIGDRVTSMPFVLKTGGPALLGSNPETPGAYGQYMLLTEALLIAVPDDLPDDAAALIEPLAVALHAVNRADLKPGDACVVIGAGPIGLAIVAVLKARGVGVIVAADFSPRRRELSTALGATDVVDPKTGAAIAIAIERASGGPLVIFENTGAPGVLGQMIVEAPKDARIIGVGIAMGRESFVPLLAVTKELRLDFVVYYTPEEFAEALQMMRAGALDWRLLVTGTVGLSGVEQAFDDLRDPEQHAKILIEPWRD